MQIQVTFTTQVKAALGTDAESVSLEEGATVWDAIQKLAVDHQDVFSKYVLAGESLLPSILMSVNDRQVAMDERLSDGDQLTLLSAISGG